MRLIFTLFTALLLVTGWYADARSQVDTKSLNGEWEILFDPANSGRSQNWMLGEEFDQQSGRKRIEVPSVWEEYEEDYEGVAFYKRSFTVPEEWSGKQVQLRFGAVNYLAEVYVNDHPVGYHEGGFTPFHFDIDHLVNYDGENTLVVRVVGPVTFTDQTIDGMGKMETPQWRGAYTGGIWQPVTLRASGKVGVSEVFLEPDITNNAIAIHYELTNATTQTQRITLQSQVYPDGDEATLSASWREQLVLHPGNHKKSITLPIDDATLWSLSNPHLYRLNTRITRGGTVSDEQDNTFGLREFTIKNDRFYLNGEPIYLKATFFEGLYPVHLAYPDSREMAIREITLAKKAGFNMIRPWRKPPPPMWLDLADSLGVLVVGGLAVESMGKPNATPYLPERVEAEVRETIMRDRNHPSVVQWELFNEIRRPVLKNMLHPMSILARTLDPTRLILDESGGWAQGANIYLPYEYEPVKFNDIHHYSGPNITPHYFDRFLAVGKTNEELDKLGLPKNPPGRNVVPGLMSFLSEVGYGSLPDLEMNNRLFRERGNPITPPYKYHQRLHEETEAALEITGLDTLFGSTRNFYLEQQEVHGMANKRMLEAIRANPDIAGYCVHALTAGDWIIGAGLLDLWRNPKGAAYELTRQANQPQLAIIRMLPRNIYSGEQADLQVLGVNELDNTKVTLTVRVHREGTTVLEEEVIESLNTGVSHLFERAIDTSEMQGHYTVEVVLRTRENASVLARNERKFYVFDRKKLQAPEMKVALFNENDRLAKFLNAAGIEVVSFDEATERSTLVVAGRARTQSKEYRQKVELLNRFVADGGRALLLEVPGKRVRRTGPNDSFQQVGPELLPSKPVLKSSKGLWDGILHMVHDHPLFKGLPVEQPMVSLYENIAPTESLLHHEGESAVTTVAFNRIKNGDSGNRTYIGPGHVWWASDLVKVPHQKGSMLLSTLKLIPNLGEDPVADMMLFNMLEFMNSR